MIPKHSLRAASSELRRVLSEYLSARTEVERELILSRVGIVARDLDALCDEESDEPPDTQRSRTLSPDGKEVRP